MTHGGNQFDRAKDSTLYSGGYPYSARSTDNGSSWEQIKQGRVYSWYMESAATAKTSTPHPRTRISPFSWRPKKTAKPGSPLNDQKFSAVHFAMAYDPVNRILYQRLRASLAVETKVTRNQRTRCASVAVASVPSALIIVTGLTNCTFPKPIILPKCDWRSEPNAKGVVPV